MPTSRRVSSSAQSSTTTATFASLSLNFLGRRRRARSTSASNSRRVISSPLRAPAPPTPPLGWFGGGRAAPPDVDGDADGPLGGLLDVPLDVHQSLPVQDALGHGEAVPCVNGEAAAAGDEAHDLVARQRVAALRPPYEQVLHAPDADALLRLGPGRRRLGLVWGLENRRGRELVEDMMDRGLAVADGCQHD